MKKNIGLVLFKNGEDRLFDSLSCLCGMTFVKKVGNQILFCGNEALQWEHERRRVQMFVHLLLGVHAECLSFPLVCYNSEGYTQQEIILMETLFFS